MKKMLLEKFASNVMSRKDSASIVGGYGGGTTCDQISCIGNYAGCGKCISPSSGTVCCSSNGATCCP